MDPSESRLASHEPRYPFSRRRARSSARQILWGMLNGDHALVEIAKARISELPPPDQKWAQVVIEECQEKLDEATRCVDQWRLRPFYFWELIHQVDDLLLLILPEDFLPARAVEIKAMFEKKIDEGALRDQWLGADGEVGPLRRTVRRLAPTEAQLAQTQQAQTQPAQPQSLTPDEMTQHRLILQGALRAVNKQVNSGFWQLSMNVTVQVWSGVLLVALFVLALFFAPHSPFAGGATLRGVREYLNLEGSQQVFSLILLGAGGAIASNMLSKATFTFAIGATTRYFIYNVLIKPALGGFAGMVVYLLERAGGFAPSPNDTRFLFVTAVLSVAAGFSAERWLKNTMDKTLDKMFQSSEKSSLLSSETA